MCRRAVGMIPIARGIVVLTLQRSDSSPPAIQTATLFGLMGRWRLLVRALRGWFSIALRDERSPRSSSDQILQVMPQIVSALRQDQGACQYRYECIEADLVYDYCQCGSGGGGMLNVQGDHKKHGQCDCDGTLDTEWQCDGKEYGSCGQADDMTADDVPGLCGDTFWHCEYDECCGSDCACYDHSFLAEYQYDDEKCCCCQEALDDVIYPEFFEFGLN